MMKKFILAYFGMVLFIACGNAQVDDTYMTKADSSAFVNAQWETTKQKGFEIRKHHFQHHQIFQSNQNFSILVIPKDSPCSIHFGYDTVRTPTSVQAQRHDALAAVNGSFFDMEKHFPVCYLKIDSMKVGENVPQKKDSINRKYYQSGCLVIDKGQLKIVPTEPSRVWEDRLDYSNIMTAGPLLIHEGKAIDQRQDRTFVTLRHNRTAVGIRNDGTILMLVVDGRTTESEGLTLRELTTVMRWLGCSEVLNLDGGGSSTLYLKDFGANGVVNFPTDNGKYDHAGERGVSNIIYIK